MMAYLWHFCVAWSLVAATHFLGGAEGCRCDETFCNCSSMHLTHIPSKLPRQLKRLDLSKNEIQYISNTDLQPYEELEELILNHNQIGNISLNAFLWLISLKVLDLSYNKLSSLSPAWFETLHKLQNLNLLGNQYPSLGKEPLFPTLTSLKELKLGNPNFVELQNHDFTGLFRLDELELNMLNLILYANGTLKTMETIGHIALTANLTLLPEVTTDLALSVTVFEVRHMTFEVHGEMEAFAALNDTTVKVLKFQNCTITDNSGARLIEIMNSYKNVTDFALEDCVLLGTGHGAPVLKNENSSLSTIFINHLIIPKFYLFSDLSFIYKMVQRLKKVSCINSKVFLMPCEFSRSFWLMEYLDLSENIMTDLLLQSASCYLQGYGAWPSLKTINVSNNRLSSLQKVAMALSHVPHLTSIDLSHNDFGSSGTTLCSWPENLTFLNISNCQLRGITGCIPNTLETLDVSFNNLDAFIFDVPNLKELYISNNRLARLPGEAHLPSLGLLVISTNRLTDFYQSDLSNFPNLTQLDARDNFYFCSCQFVDFISQRHDQLVGWPRNYACNSPSSVRGNPIDRANLPPIMCHRTLIVSLVCVILILGAILLVAFCHYFHVVWYVKMTCAWLNAKRKPQKVITREILYDAYVSYSEKDSEWVENRMLPLLENEDPAFKICFHKRDFVPGKTIIDNIIDAMETSYKTLFILSEHFVQSEWCKYELEFSHFRLFDENNDTVILVILELIESSTIPRRFAKLRKLMNTKTYLKWPTEEEEQQIFWSNLKAALQPEDYPQA